jgi:hypothetical protein
MWQLKSKFRTVALPATRSIAYHVHVQIPPTSAYYFTFFRNVGTYLPNYTTLLLTRQRVSY